MIECSQPRGAKPKIKLRSGVKQGLCVIKIYCLSGPWHCAVCYMVINISDKHNISIFKV